MTLPPATPQAIVADQEWMRVAINDWLRSSGLPIVDCESVLGGDGPGGRRGGTHRALAARCPISAGDLGIGQAP
jgi:hypothetical protein